MSVDLRLNDVLTTLYSDIKELEEKALIKGDNANISYNDINVIAAIGDGLPKSSSEVSKKLRVTMGTLTKAIDGLTLKGYVLRERSEKDKRKVLLSLSEKGVKLYLEYQKFHKEMIDAIMKDLDESDLLVLDKLIGTVSTYLTPQV